MDTDCTSMEYFFDQDYVTRNADTNLISKEAATLDPAKKHTLTDKIGLKLFLSCKVHSMAMQPLIIC